jgi:energy-coupling factor transporter ATP-binding protein EcfA2
VGDSYARAVDRSRAGLVRPRPSRRLRPIELTEAVILGDVSVALCVLGRFLPGGGVFRVIAVIPLAAVAARHRLRALVAAAVAASVVAFLVAGGGIVVSVLGCAVLGCLVGVASRRNWGAFRTASVAALLLWPPIAISVVAVLLMFSELRRLTFVQVRNSWLGASRILRDVGLDRMSSAGDEVVHFVLRWWWIFIPLAILAGVVAATLVARLIAIPVLRRMGIAAPVGAGDTGIASEGREESPGPVPARLDDVAYSFANAARPALQGITMTVRANELLAVVGPNGSGKSTLIRLLAGRAPTTGEITRPGLVALGGIGGTGQIFQRPEAQVLGVRVRDDVVWGLPPGYPIEVLDALDHVGLAELADRETATLSGGELQRLAIAAALARRPALMLSDESTAMVDHTGRDGLMQLFSTLATRDHLAVVHVTHDRVEARSAGRVIALHGGKLVADGSTRPVARPDLVNRGEQPRSVTFHDECLTLEDMGHVYSRGSPWAHRALQGINLSVRTGEGILVVGSNGSGKSTLAWILAGLVIPSEGHARLEGRAVHRQVGRVALSLQHARLQLLRPTVAEDIVSAAGADALGVSDALALVGLDPSMFRDRRIDELSGGEQRRVAIAGLLARQPRLLVLDEPFAGLDDEARDILASVLDRLQREARTTLVIVSHDLDPAFKIVDRVVTLDAGTLTSDAPVEQHPSIATGGVDHAC